MTSRGPSDLPARRGHGSLQRQAQLSNPGYLPPPPPPFLLYSLSFFHFPLFFSFQSPPPFPSFLLRFFFFFLPSSVFSSYPISPIYPPLPSSPSPSALISSLFLPLPILPPFPLPFFPLSTSASHSSLSFPHPSFRPALLLLLLRPSPLPSPPTLSLPHPTPPFSLLRLDPPFYPPFAPPFSPPFPSALLPSLLALPSLPLRPSPLPSPTPPFSFPPPLLSPRPSPLPYPHPALPPLRPSPLPPFSFPHPSFRPPFSPPLPPPRPSPLPSPPPFSPPFPSALRPSPLLPSLRPALRPAPLPRRPHELPRGAPVVLPRRPVHHHSGPPGRDPRRAHVNINTQNTQVNKQLTFLLPFFGFGLNYTWVSLNGYLGFSDAPFNWEHYPLSFPVPQWPEKPDPSFIGPFYSKQDHITHSQPRRQVSHSTHAASLVLLSTLRPVNLINKRNSRESYAHPLSYKHTHRRMPIVQVSLSFIELPGLITYSSPCVCFATLRSFNSVVSSEFFLEDVDTSECALIQLLFQVIGSSHSPQRNAFLLCTRIVSEKLKPGDDDSRRPGGSFHRSAMCWQLLVFVDPEH
ncbi:hypothetical protein C7M84_003488 [Penaeus vannamei]|uniref:Uncharacterized protein n=1 Tax=Penaeus vannamei TaxID=6689 RepID=A0A3R7P7P9_PENVA|nr:hypothetical protein C7M84_003488 [Penaeus vannamei]